MRAVSYDCSSSLCNCSASLKGSPLMGSGATPTHQGLPWGCPPLNGSGRARGPSCSAAACCGDVPRKMAGGTAAQKGGGDAAGSRSCKTSPVTRAAGKVCGALKRRCLDPSRAFGAPVTGAMRVCGCRGLSWACKTPLFTGGAGRDAFSIFQQRAWWVSDPDVPFTKATSLLLAENQCPCLEWSLLHPGTRRPRASTTS